MRELAVVWFVVMVGSTIYGAVEMSRHETVGEPMAMCSDYWRLDPDNHPWCADVLGVQEAPGPGEPARGPAVRRGAPATGLDTCRDTSSLHEWMQGTVAC